MTEDNPQITNKFAVQKRVSETIEYIISIWDGIDEYEEYQELLDTLHKIKPTDKCTIKISTYGGRCDIGFALIDKIQELKCKVNIEVPYPTYSMGAIMALCGSSLKINPGGFLMFHDYSAFEMGKGNEIAKSTEAYREAFECRLKLICQPFLTRAEVKSILSGQDLYIKWNDSTIKERLKRHFK